jgi:transcription elongation factor GreB
MSKAFTRETDNEDVLSLVPEMPSGVRNYITPTGLLALHKALRELTEMAAAVPPHDLQAQNEDAAPRLDEHPRDLEQRMHYLRTRIESAEPVDPAVHAGNDRIFFGATVTYRDASKERHTITIVGLDEIDPANGRISWLSPVAQALLNARAGEMVELEGPVGAEELTILTVRYPQSSE